MKRLILLVFLVLAFLIGGAGGYSQSMPLPVRAVEQKAEVEYFVIKNATDCITVDFVIYEVEEGESPLAVAGGVVGPGECKEFQLPAGQYCMTLIVIKDGVVFDKAIRCGIIPDPNIPENAKPTFVIECDESNHPEKFEA
jgi:hypothetical protein